MKDSISVLAFVLTLLVFQKVYVESYSLKCPSQGSWKIQAKSKCNSTLKYFCLYDNLRERYVEGCKGPDWDRKGSKRIFSVFFTRGKCIPKRYQPFRFQTNESMSDCIYAKSLCSEEGQIVYEDDSTKDDRTCRCDYTRNYSFIKIPKHVCYCIPTEEDCSCYIKACQPNFTLSTDYNCTPNDYKAEPKCINTIRDSTTIEEQIEVNTETHYIDSEHRWNDILAGLMLFFVCIISILGFVIVSKWSREKLQSLNICFRIVKKDENDSIRRDTLETVDRNYQELCKSSTGEKTQDNMTTDELNFLRMIHLLFRVACPIVRMIFDHEIQPKNLRRTLERHKSTMEKQYRKHRKIISKYQWDLLYQHVKGEPVTSENFDIRLMVLVLKTLASIRVGDLYPVKSDRSLSAMLSRINYIRNETTQNVEGILSDDRFNQYWDDVGQAVLNLVTPYTTFVGENEDQKQLIGRLVSLNPIDLDEHKVCRYICMSEKYPAQIIQKILFEYCTLSQQMIADMLREEKHDLYHKRIQTESCCVCDQIEVKFSTYAKVISERQWEAMYEMNKERDFHSCPSNLKKCSESFIPKKIDTSDLSLTLTLVLNTPDLVKHIINRLCTNGFQKFLKDNKHKIYHSMENKECCKCCKTPTEKRIITKKEWIQLFKKEDDTLCKSGNTNCCCQYLVRNDINSSNMNDTLLSKILHVAGPISVLNKIKQDSFLYYLNWSYGNKDLKETLTALLSIINDDDFHRDMLQKLSSIDDRETDETVVHNGEAHGWISKHTRNQQAPTDRPLQIIILDKDGPNVKTVQISEDFLLPNRIRRFNDLTEEETNFLVIVHALKQIVYPVIKDEFNTHCPDNELEKIRMDIYEQQTHSRKDLRYKENKGERKNIYLTQKQQNQLFSPRNEEPRNLDMKLMIYILRRRIEEEGKTDYVDQLNVIDNITREIVQSSCGVLNETRFQEKLHLIKKAVMHFGEEVYKEQIVKLQQSRNIKELL